jgi:hypothetical protein
MTTPQLVLNNLTIHNDLIHQFDDLEFVTKHLRGIKLPETHKFVDAELFGLYINLRWAERDARKLVEQGIEYLQEQTADTPKLYANILWGSIRAEQFVFSGASSLLKTLRQDYVTGKHQDTGYDNGLSKWWTELLKVIDIVDHDKPELDRWCQEVRREKDKYKSSLIEPIVNSIKSIGDWQPKRRVLWPLELPNDNNRRPDANYDFPSLAERIDDAAIQAVYDLNNSSTTTKVSVFDICRDYLSQHTHHLVAGHHRSGKTWLRLYLEYFSLMTDDRLLPLFYFTSATVAYQTTEVEIVQNLARSVANQLFATLLVRSANATSINDPWRASRMAIIPFLRRYGYTLPSNHDSLAQPIPPRQLLDIEMAYGKSYLAALYTPMKEAINAVPVTEYTIPSVAEIFEDIQRAIELAGYQQIFVLVDNWEDLPAVPRQRLLQHLLQPSLLQQLSQHGIFLKLFMPAMADSTLACFEKTCEIQRESSPKLTLYTYRDSNAEPESV